MADRPGPSDPADFRGTPTIGIRSGRFQANRGRAGESHGGAVFRGMAALAGYGIALIVTRSRWTTPPTGWVLLPFCTVTSLSRVRYRDVARHRQAGEGALGHAWSGHPRGAGMLLDLRSQQLVIVATRGGRGPAPHPLMMAGFAEARGQLPRWWASRSSRSLAWVTRWPSSGLVRVSEAGMSSPRAGPGSRSAHPRPGQTRCCLPTGRHGHGAA